MVMVERSGVVGCGVWGVEGGGGYGMEVMTAEGTLVLIRMYA
jgi:hypothetical protein